MILLLSGNLWLISCDPSQAAEAWGCFRGPESGPQSPGGDGGLCVRAPGTSAAIYKTETRHEGEVPEGTYIFQREKKKRLNYIFQRHRHAEEYQQCLGPEAEMPKMRIWKINTVELGIVACFFPPGAPES